MRLLVTGATGVLGREAVPALHARGHEVDAVVRDDAAATRVSQQGARPVQLDLLDPEQVRAAASRVDGIVHLATAIPPLRRMARRRAWHMTDRLRDEATGHLVDAAIATRAEVVVLPSITFNYADGGQTWLDEDAELDPPFGATESALRGEQHVHRVTAAGARGVVLRMGRFHGPGAASAEEAAQARATGPIVIGRGQNLVSSIHVADAGAAVAVAIDAPAGTYNVVDDTPQTAVALATAMAAGTGGRPPRHLPTWFARLLLGRATNLLTVSQRVSNQRFREATGWAPAHPDACAWWRQQSAGG